MIITEKKIWEKLDTMYADKKSQKFIDHLIKSYLPKNKIERVIVEPKGRFRCALTNMNLVCLEEVYKEIGDDSVKKDKFIDFVNTMFSDEVVQPPKLNVLNRKSVGLTGKDTDTFLRYETFIAFFNWVQNKIIEGDKHIYWLIKQMQGEDDFKVQRIDEGTKEEKVKLVPKNKIIKSTFGDLDILHELKAKFKEQERK